ncbi:unnamed protein product [Dibothriocephalus latus]|uniref:Uncharacterized protein n=1 Tax=Dibothriocephalus latus TaxID=60516 RepID=A0A3P6UYN4_DIBLA|nr:unnamed protein product [Dibothriocephalus latus]
MQKAEVAHVAETKAANNPEKAKEAKEEAKRITEELRTRVPDVDKIVQSNITKFAKDYLIFVNEELKADDKAPSEYSNDNTVADDIVPKKPALSTLARSEPSTYDVPSKPSENGTANSSEKKQTLAATAATACLVDLVKDSDSESESGKKEKNKKTDKDEDEIEGASSTSEVSESRDSESEKQAQDSENSEEDHEAEDLCSLPTPFKASFCSSLKTLQSLVVAVFPYKAQEEDELEMTQDDVINVTGGDDIQKTSLLSPPSIFLIVQLLLEF